MGVSVVWKIGAPSRRCGLHAFLSPGLAGERAVCSRTILADGFPLGDPKKGPKCRHCVERLDLMEEHGLTEMRDNFAGLIRSKNLKVEIKSHWWVERHGGKRSNKWRREKHGDQKTAEAFYFVRATYLKVEKNRRRGGVRLVNPDGVVEREFIRSPWMKSSVLPSAVGGIVNEERGP